MRRLKILLKNILSIPYRFFCTHVSVFCVLQDAKVDKTAAISLGVKFYRGKLGRYSYINRNSFISDTNIGNFTSIGSGCEIGGAAHALQWVSTSPVFHKWGNIMKKNFTDNDFKIFKCSTIGNDVWIGSNCMIKSGVVISNGAVIGMGSVVTKDVGPYEIWAGNPARLIRKRFDDETIEKLQRIEWWNFEDDKIEQYAPYIKDVGKFIENVLECECV